MDEKDEKIIEASKADAPVDEAPIYGDPEKAGTEIITLSKASLPLHPQPTSDPLDPLNWSKWRKHGILGIVMLK